ncbi:sugar transferase [Nocardioides campestrisoli]|uniref:sugar transferase n=1 Tax=Nocardioides campestrisoli TaxID=2736757 RepID=UPI0015E7D713|nr:sugar transferase [Nocardioides campestrisoli]
MKAYDPFKRAIDLVVGGVALVASLPAQLLIAVLVRTRLGSPVLFRQPRPGKDERVFELVKFRTMLEPDEARGLVTDEQRMTPFGSFLRATSLDELPTLWNVVRGDMSLVGPRPLLVRYLDRYSPEQRRRHEVRPGVTGLAQVSGRNAIGWDAKFAKDVEYVDGRSLMLDLKILLRTVSGVLRRDGISADGEATMSEFTGGPTQVSEVSGHA